MIVDLDEEENTTTGVFFYTDYLNMLLERRGKMRRVSQAVRLVLCL